MLWKEYVRKAIGSREGAIERRGVIALTFDASLSRLVGSLPAILRWVRISVIPILIYDIEARVLVWTHGENRVEVVNGEFARMNWLGTSSGDVREQMTARIALALGVGNE